MTAVLEACGVVKSFGHVEVLREVAFSARAGEVTALIGDDGAGKSTLIKILSGAPSTSWPRRRGRSSSTRRR